MSLNFTDSHPKARTAHLCSMCARRIDPGETYRRGAGMDGSTAWTWKECTHCAALVQYVHSLWGEGEYGPDLIIEWEPETVHHLRIKALYLRKWRHRDGTLHPAPEVVWARDDHGFGWPSDIRMGGAA